MTRVFCELMNGDQDAATQLWKFLQKRLLRLSKNVTQRRSGLGYDEQDVAQSAFFALCDGCETQRYSEVANRDELWRLLTVITVNKARKKAAFESRLRRGGNFHRIENGQQILDLLADRSLDPQFSLVAQEECTRLLNLLGKKELQMVAILKVDGFTNEEVASRLGCTRRAVQRRLALIRDLWSEEAR